MSVTSLPRASESAGRQTLAETLRLQLADVEDCRDGGAHASPLPHPSAASGGASRPGTRRDLAHHQYDFGMPRTFSAMKFRIICGLTGAMRAIMASRR
jgi:hypothetical protein